MVECTARGRNLGRQLVERMPDAGRAAGYTRICLDVPPEFAAARQLCESPGFTEAPPVTLHPVPGTRFPGMNL